MYFYVLWLETTLDYFLPLKMEQENEEFVYRREIILIYHSHKECSKCFQESVSKMLLGHAMLLLNFHKISI